MFTGIIEDLGIIKKITKESGNVHFSIFSRLTKYLKIDQSVSHNGVCLTVIDISENQYTVTAIEETLQKTNINNLNVGDRVNLERAATIGSRLDGHIVQGHIDQVGLCVDRTENQGSWNYTFSYDISKGNVTIEKGSITVNGVSLTVINSKKGSFSVAIIPYTYENTVFQDITKDSVVNLEFDVIGKYVKRLTAGY